MNSYRKHANIFWITLFSTLILFVTHRQVVAMYGDECITPNNTTGQCMPVHSCSGILESLQRHGSELPLAQLNFIQKSFCGYFNDVHHVCCARDEVTLNSVGLDVLQNVSCGFFDIPRVAHGQEARLFTFPWMALLKYDEMPPFKCGATLISERYVLTAAHCVVGREDGLIEVRLGELKISSEQDCEKFGKHVVCAPPVEDVVIEKIIPHPDYRINQLYHDIALIRLNRAVEFKQHIRAICLPITQQLIQSIPEEYFVSGWGYTEQGMTSDVLKWATIPHKDRSDCQQVFRRPITESQICAGSEDKQDSCRGDSGGPIANVGRYKKMYRLIQYGIVSFGVRSCGVSNLPAVYTNISYYMQWITDTIRV